MSDSDSAIVEGSPAKKGGRGICRGGRVCVCMCELCVCGWVVSMRLRDAIVAGRGFGGKVLVEAQW